MEDPDSSQCDVTDCDSKSIMKKCKYHRNKYRREKYKEKKANYKPFKDSIKFCDNCEGKRVEDLCKDCGSLYRKKLRHERKGGK